MSAPRLQDVVVVLQNDADFEKGANGLSSVELRSRALQMLSPKRPPDERLLSGLLLAAARIDVSVLEAMVQLPYGVPGWFFARLLPQFIRLSCKYYSLELCAAATCLLACCFTAGSYALACRLLRCSPPRFLQPATLIQLQLLCYTPACLAAGRPLGCVA